MIRIAIETVAYFIGIAACIAVLMFAAGVQIDFISNPLITIAERAQ